MNPLIYYKLKENIINEKELCFYYENGELCAETILPTLGIVKVVLEDKTKALKSGALKKFEEEIDE